MNDVVPYEDGKYWRWSWVTILSWSRSSLDFSVLWMALFLLTLMYNFFLFTFLSISCSSFVCLSLVRKLWVIPKDHFWCSAVERTPLIPLGNQFFSSSFLCCASEVLLCTYFPHTLIQKGFSRVHTAYSPLFISCRLWQLLLKLCLRTPCSVYTGSGWLTPGRWQCSLGPLFWYPWFSGLACIFLCFRGRFCFSAVLRQAFVVVG